MYLVIQFGIHTPLTLLLLEMTMHNPIYLKTAEKLHLVTNQNRFFEVTWR